MKRKLLSVMLVSVMALSMVACGADAGDNATAVTDSADTSGEKVYNVGVIQYVQHDALDAATDGFTDALKEKFGDKINITVQNAAGDADTCNTIAEGYVSEGVDLIMANATTSLQAATQATDTIPIVATSITDYSTALSIDDWDGTTGINVTGTSDFAPLDGQADMIHELFPDATNVGILYCSEEANSLYQVNTITTYLEKYGYTVTNYTFDNAEQVQQAAEEACTNSDVVYIPTDNTAASCTSVIYDEVVNSGTPIIAGEENLCKGCGVATLSISYYDIGYAAGLMAYDILVNGADTTNYPIEYASDYTKKYNPEICETLGLSIPEDYEPIVMEEE